MKTIKVMSIIALALFGLGLLVAFGAYANDYTGAPAWLIIDSLFGISLAIVALVKSNKK